MASFTVLKCEDKNPEWKVLTLKMGEGSQLADVSVNKVNKKGEVFPEFDAIAEGKEVAGELWESSSHKWYLFAPRAASPWKGGGGGAKTAAVEKAMDRKEQSIEKFQDEKERSIRLAGAMRDATLISLAALKDQPFPTDEEFKAEWTKWVKWILNVGDQPFI